MAAPTGKGSKSAPGKRSNKSSLGPKKDSSSRVSKPSSKKSGPRPTPKQQKTKSPTKTPNNMKKKKRIYTAEELGIPQLNMITPVGVEKPKGKKKGKVFVDDAEGMMTILAMVHADKEGQIESKMLKARHLEDLREARRQAAERKEDERRGKLEGVKDGLRKKRSTKKVRGGGDGEAVKEVGEGKKTKKRVSFG